MCGEHVRLDLEGPVHTDSPPRVRGARAESVDCGAQRRLTPACAGSTKRERERDSEKRESTHPRVCGEHGLIVELVERLVDSPPRVRGALRRARRSVTSRSTHPRVCGEHGGVLSSAWDFVDSPPRVRGARAALGSGLGALRLTPACAGSTRFSIGSGCCATTHPRVCGEHPHVHALVIPPDDSPPRVRGALVHAVLRRERPRLTPACAGSTFLLSSGQGFHPTHPRVCGEHASTSGLWAWGYDSPPRVRGAHYLASLIRCKHRLTPACAGSTCAMRIEGATNPTHPRVCGEHCQSGHVRRRINDSPPRVRGAPRVSSPGCLILRLTPACAGSTTHARSCPGSRSTHPRVCGEHDHRSRRGGRGLDSPPRVRGARRPALSASTPRGLTPACAGSTPHQRLDDHDAPTHPRVCGEHDTDRSEQRYERDSPPRVRGALLGAGAGDQHCRLTPACAGSTAGRWRSRQSDATHPRVCGEHVTGINKAFATIDSPPRVRGAHRPRPRRLHHTRLTPACAGSTRV